MILYSWLRALLIFMVMSAVLTNIIPPRYEGSKVVNTSTDDTIFTEEEPDDESLEEPGSVILTSGQGVSSSVISEAKLNREQIRAKNTENLTNIVNDTAIDKASKTEAINELAKIAEYSEKEAAIELLLEAKGFNDVVASVAEDSVDIVINQQTLENSQKAQIEDIAKRKTGVTSDKITINVIK
jgi:stage III sporulation protein AH